jgi:hypothetical protein
VQIGLERQPIAILITVGQPYGPKRELSHIFDRVAQKAAEIVGNSGNSIGTGIAAQLIVHR